MFMKFNIYFAFQKLQNIAWIINYECMLINKNNNWNESSQITTYPDNNNRKQVLRLIPPSPFVFTFPAASLSMCGAHCDHYLPEDDPAVSSAIVSCSSAIASCSSAFSTALSPSSAASCIATVGGGTSLVPSSSCWYRDFGSGSSHTTSSRPSVSQHSESTAAAPAAAARPYRSPPERGRWRRAPFRSHSSRRGV